MVDRINQRTAFGPVVGYACRANKDPEVVASSLCAATPAEMIKEFEGLARRNTRCQKPCVHVVLSPATGERLTRAQWRKLCEKTAAEFGATQWVGVLHNDTAIQHCSLVLSRIGPDGRAWSTSNDRYRLRKLCRDFEAEHGLRPTAERSQEIRIGKTEIEKADRLYRTGKRPDAVPERLAIAVSVKAAFRQSATLAEFEDRLLRQKITTRWRHDEQGRPVGVSYGRGEASITGKNAGVTCRMLTVNYSDQGTSTHEQTRKLEIPGGTSSVDRTAGQAGIRIDTCRPAGQHRGLESGSWSTTGLDRGADFLLRDNPPVREVGELVVRATSGLEIMSEDMAKDGQRYTNDNVRKRRFIRRPPTISP